MQLKIEQIPAFFVPSIGDAQRLPRPAVAVFPDPDNFNDFGLRLRAWIAFLPVEEAEMLVFPLRLMCVAFLIVDERAKAKLNVRESNWRRCIGYDTVENISCYRLALERP